MDLPDDPVKDLLGELDPAGADKLVELFTRAMTAVARQELRTSLEGLSAEIARRIETSLWPMVRVAVREELERQVPMVLCPDGPEAPPETTAAEPQPPLSEEKLTESVAERLHPGLAKAIRQVLEEAAAPAATEGNPKPVVKDFVRRMLQRQTEHGHRHHRRGHRGRGAHGE